MLRTLLVASMLFMLAGCRPAAPQLVYQSVKFTPISFQEIKASIHGTISNDNLFPLSGKIAYTTKLNGKTLFSGNSESFSVGSQQTAPFTLDTTIDLPQAYGSLQELLSKITAGETELPFALEGEYATQAILGIPLKAPLKAEGKIPLPKLPKISLTNISVKSLSLTQAKLKISAKVANNNAVPINVQQFAYTLLGNKTELASSSFSGNISVAANQTETIDWELTLNLSALDSQLAKQLLDGSLQTKLQQTFNAIE